VTVDAPIGVGRPGGRWSYPALTDDLTRLVFLERATAHVLAGWIVKVPDLDAKLVMGQHLDNGMDRATQLRHVLLTRHDREASGIVVPRSWVELMKGIDRSASASDLLAAIYLRVKPLVLDHYRRLLGQADPLFDARLVRLVRGWLPELEAELDRLATNVGGEDVGGGLDRAAGEDVVTLDAAMWPPLDRVPHAIRPDGVRRPETGALRELPVGSLLDATNVAMFVHDSVNSEFTALELMSRNSYEHPDLPWAFHASMARHAGDEARHALILERFLAERGVAYGDYQVHSNVYDQLYQFGPCECGGMRELVWRLLMLSTCLEGLAIDDFAFEARRRDHLGQHDLARVFDYILADEVFHAENGLRWSRELCAAHRMDPVLERELAHGHYWGTLVRQRETYVEANPERADGEIARLRSAPAPEAVPVERGIDVARRRIAGYDDEEIEQVVRWGYWSATGSHPPAGAGQPSSPAPT